MIVHRGRAPCAWHPSLRLVINEDNSHFYGYRSAEDMTVEGLRSGTASANAFSQPRVAMTRGFGLEYGFRRVWRRRAASHE